MAPAEPPRVVLFLTVPCDPSVPMVPGSLACLLPMGWASFAERVLDACAKAGVTQLDVVACDQPEQLRALLSEGERWGLSLHWHLVKDAQTPYGILKQLANGTDRLLVGHAHQWVDAEVVRTLLLQDRVAMVMEPRPTWVGWASLPAVFAHAVSPHADLATLSELMVSLQARQCLMLEPGHTVRTGTAAELLQVQSGLLAEPVLAEAPASWLRMPWGLLSPLAQVHPQAELTGPCLIGPGCLVSRGAVIGPGTVLSRDVMVASGAVVRNTLVLPNTYVSGEVTLERAVAQGTRVHQLDWGVTNELSTADALMADLAMDDACSEPPAASWTGRLVGGVLSLLLAPVAGVLGLPDLLAFRAPWQTLDAVVHASGNGVLQIRTLRQRRPAHTWRVRFMGAYGALLDVAQGRRSWWGVRPRTASQWYALRRDWQELFSRSPVGFFHAPAWADGECAGDSEMLAAADAYFAAASRTPERLRLLGGLLGLRRVGNRLST